jgi:hypothetical protein
MELFDGNSKVIVLNLKEDNSELSGGLFGIIHNSAVVKNLGIIGADIRLTSTENSARIGALAATASGNSSIINCYVRNSIIRVNCQTGGGLIGGLVYNAQMYNCYITGTTVELQGNNQRVGGLIGWTTVGSDIVKNCYSTAILSSTVSNNTITGIGGLYGVSSSGTFNNCYYRTDWKGANLTGTPTENSNFTSNSSTIYSKTTTDMQASSFVLNTGAAGTTLNLASTVVSGATTYKQIMLL